MRLSPTPFFLVLALAACGSEDAAPPPVDHVSACWVETGHADVAGFGSFTASGLLVRHPAGTLLIDAGASTHFDDEIEPYTGEEAFFLETITSILKPQRPIGEALEEVGVRARDLTALLPSHIHVDHVGGLMDLPDLPVLLDADEAALARRGLSAILFEVVPAHAERLVPLIEDLVLDDGAHEGFATSADLFGDGTVVAVPLPGHTPGSIGVFVTLPDGTRLLHVGDTLSSRAQLSTGEGKEPPMDVTDSDPAATLARVLELQALAAREPDLLVVPAHEREAWTAALTAPGTCR